MRECKVCKTPIEGKRSVAITCSAACRKEYSRRNDMVITSLNRVMTELQVIRRAIKNYPEHRDYINSQLNFISGEIRDLLVLGKDAEAMARLEMLNGLKKR